jgi:thioesterase domain-containing protein
MIRNRQPDGPLALAGYSIGGLVAYEVARQAIDAGQQIEWLGILDTTAPPLERAQSQMRGRLHSVHQGPLRERWAKYAELALRAVRRLLPQRQRGFDLRGAAKIGRRYRQPGHRVPMHLYVSDVSAAAAGDDLLGWGEFHRGPVEGLRLAGDHLSLLRLPGAGLLATSMLESLCTASESTCGAGRSS